MAGWTQGEGGEGRAAAPRTTEGGLGKVRGDEGGERGLGGEGMKGGVTVTAPAESSRDRRPSSSPRRERRPEGRSFTSLSPEDLTMAGDVEQRECDEEVSNTPEAQPDQLRSSQEREGKPDHGPASPDLRGAEGTGIGRRGVDPWALTREAEPVRRPPKGPCLEGEGQEGVNEGLEGRGLLPTETDRASLSSGRTGSSELIPAAPLFARESANSFNG